MTRYRVTGMNCAACQARVEKAVGKVQGVEECTVSLLTNSMRVEGSADPKKIIAAVETAGYGASLVKTEGADSGISYDGAGGTGDGASLTGVPDQTIASLESLEEDFTDTETPKLLKRLIASLIFLLPLMYVSMGHGMWNWPLPALFVNNPAAVGILEMLLSVVVMVINQRFFVNGWKGLLHRAPNMDTLVALGSFASFGYSVFVLFTVTATMTGGNGLQPIGLSQDYYFESAAMILTLITVGKMLEARSKGKTTDALKSLMKLRPKTATVLKDGAEITIPVGQVRVGDFFVIKPGEQIPVDGIVTEGFSAVNEAAFSGESVPVEKKEGDFVSAGTLNTNGHLICQAEKIGEDTALSKVIRMVSDAAASKAPIARIADRISGVFVPVVLGISLVTFVVWLLLGEGVGYAIGRAISVLVISCPCALGLATPVAIMVGNGVAAKAGILFKNSAALEQTGGVQIVALDKTGTVTTGIMQVTDVCPATGVEREELLMVAASLEAKSEHPIAAAITEAVKTRRLCVGTAFAESVGESFLDVTDFTAVAGNGLSGKIGGEQVFGGNRDFVEAAAKVSVGDLSKQAHSLAGEGKTPVYFAKENRLLGMLAVADTIKEDSTQAVSSLEKMGLQVVMLTGDNDVTAQAIAKKAGIRHVISSVKPEEKAEVIAKLSKVGSVAMVGDGINDAPALTKADIGIAIGAGTDVAIDAAQIVLMKDSIREVAAAIYLSRVTVRNIRENLFWAFFYNLFGIPLAAGCFAAAFGWTLNPMFGAAAMSLSSFCVVSNALRLNFVKVYDQKRYRGKKNSVDSSTIEEIVLQYKKNEKARLDGGENSNTEERTETMEKITIGVSGMMCAHCEARMKGALEKLEAVAEAVPNHDENLVVLSLTGEVTEEVLKATVEDAGYVFEGMK